MQARLTALAERAGRSYGAALESWLETAVVLKEVRAIAGHGEWLPFLDSAGIPARVAQRMLRIADIGAKYDSKSYLEAVKALGGIEATLDALAASPKKVRELVARHNRIAELKAALEATRDALVDLEERDALMGISPENAKHIDQLAGLQAERRELRTVVDGEKVKRAAVEVEVKGLHKQVRKAEAERAELEARTT